MIHSLNGYSADVEALKNAKILFIHLPVIGYWDQRIEISTSRVPNNSHARSLVAPMTDAPILIASIVQGTSFAEFELENPYVLPEHRSHRTYRIPATIWQRNLFSSTH